MSDIKFKDLTVDNLFDFCAVLDAIGIEDISGSFSKRDLNTLVHSKDEKSIGTAVTLKIMGIIIKNVPKAKAKICTFLANLSEHEDGSAVTCDEIRNMKIVPFVNLIKEFSKQEDLADFFGAAVGSLNMAQPTLKNS